MAFAVMGLPRCADPHADHVHDLLDQRARITRHVHRQQRAHQLNEVGASERALVDIRDHLRQPRPVQQHVRRCSARIGGCRAVGHHARCRAARGTRLKMRIAVQFQTARIGAPLFFELGPRFRFRLSRSRRFLRGGQLLCGRLTIDDDQVVMRPFPHPRGTLRPRLEAPRGDTGDFGHPRKRVHRSPFHAQLGVQLVAQGGLIHDAGGFGFVIQRLGVDRHQLAVGAGLAVGHEDVGVQVRVSAARRLMLVGNRH